MLLVSVFFTSDSGDWSHFVDYCYRPDGTLARTTSTYSSFVAANAPHGVRRERTRFFDPRGKATTIRTAVSDLATGQPLKIQVPGGEEPSYPKLGALPFYPPLAAALGTQ